MNPDTMLTGKTKNNESKTVLVHARFHSSYEIVDTFIQMGYQCETFSSPSDIESLHQSGRLTIWFAFDINYHQEIHDTLKKLDLPYVVWCFDSGMRNIAENISSRSQDFFFFHDKYDYEAFSKSKHQVWYLPFSAGGDLVVDDQPISYEYDVLVVMNTYNESVVHNEKMFLEHLKKADTELERGMFKLVKSLMDFIVDSHMDVYGENRMEMMLDQLVDECGVDPFNDNVKKRLGTCFSYGQVLSSKQRIKLVRAMGKAGIRVAVYGDDFWNGVIADSPSVDYRGKAEYKELPTLYNSAKINVNLTQIQNLGNIPQRIFHLFAANAFVLTNNSSALQECFTPDIHYAIFKNDETLIKEIFYYLSHEKERRTIATNAHQAFLESHTMKHRIEFILSKIG